MHRKFVTLRLTQVHRNCEHGDSGEMNKQIGPGIGIHSFLLHTLRLVAVGWSAHYPLITNSCSIGTPTTPTLRLLNTAGPEAPPNMQVKVTLCGKQEREHYGQRARECCFSQRISSAAFVRMLTEGKHKSSCRVWHAEKRAKLRGPLKKLAKNWVPKLSQLILPTITIYDLTRGVWF